MEVLMDIAKMDVDDQAKRQQLATLNLAQPYVKITNTGVAPELDSLYVLIPANMQFEMEWKFAQLMGLVKDGTPSERIVQEKNYLVKHIVDYDDRHKWDTNRRSCQTNIHRMASSLSVLLTPISIITSSWVRISVGSHFPPRKLSNHNKDNNNS